VLNVIFILLHMIRHGPGDAGNLDLNLICYQTIKLKVQLAWNVLTIN